MALTCGTCGDNWDRYNNCSWANALGGAILAPLPMSFCSALETISATGDKRRGASTYGVSLVGEGALATSSSFCADVFL